MSELASPIWAISEHMSVSGQLSPTQIEQLLSQGFKAAMNLRPINTTRWTMQSKRGDRSGLTLRLILISTRGWKLTPTERCFDRGKCDYNDLYCVFVY